jgi:molybdopterin-biosynthesis enzyme MoeA-like protein
MEKFYEGRGRPITSSDDARYRMVEVPHPAKIITTPGLWVPTVVVNKNVYMLPGVPSLYEQMVRGLESEFRAKGVQGFRKIVLTNMSESEIADELAQVQDTHSEQVAIGSYPKRVEVGYEVHLSVEGCDSEQVDHVASILCKKFKGSILPPKV